MAELAETRQESIRWMILLTLNNACPMGASERIVLSVVQAEFPDATQDEVRNNLDYLDRRTLVSVEKPAYGGWFCIVVPEIQTLV